MEQREEFVALARHPGTNRRELCHRFGISHETGYKWLRRAEEALNGSDWTADRSRRPHESPKRSEEALEEAVLKVRDRHPAWGARKIKSCLERDGIEAPAHSTVHAILVRHGRIEPQQRAAAHCRFEHPKPNLVWQMDFKGRFPLKDRRWCHPLTILDDHSRYALCLEACTNEQSETVRGRLERVFTRYGLPDAFLVDNGSPWGDGPEQSWTRLGVWLLKLGVDVIHSRPYHPQTRGKNERFHRTLKAEVLNLQSFKSFNQVQIAFDEWRKLYNHHRPHHALGQNVPASRYRASPRSMPDKLPEPQYQQGEITRTVGTTKTYISFKGNLWPIGKAFAGERVAIRPTDIDGQFGIFFGARLIAQIDLRDPSEASQ